MVLSQTPLLCVYADWIYDIRTRVMSVTYILSKQVIIAASFQRQWMKLKAMKMKHRVTNCLATQSLLLHVSQESMNMLLDAMADIY